MELNCGNKAVFKIHVVTFKLLQSSDFSLRSGCLRTVAKVVIIIW